MADEKLVIEYNDLTDVVTIEGVKYSGDLFRAWSKGGMELNTPFQIVKHEGDCLAIQTLTWPRPMDELNGTLFGVPWADWHGLWMEAKQLRVPVSDLLRATRIDELKRGAQDKEPPEGSWMCLTDDWTCDRKQRIAALEEEGAE